MRKTPSRYLAWALGFALIATGAACSGSSPEPDTVENPGPVSLKIGTADDDSRPGGLAIVEFVEQVRTLSGGKILVYPVWEAAGEGVQQWDQVVARMLKDKELDLAMIPSRTWDTEGVTTLRALNAPFLVTSDALADKIVTSKDMSDQLMAGLDKAGATGLALMPESLRHPFGFQHALLTPTAFKGQGIRTAKSDLGDATIRALGGKPSDANGDAFDAGIRDGTLAGAETGFVLSDALPVPGIAAANVTFSTKVNTLVANSGMLAGLSAENREILQKAAAATREWVLAHRITEAANAAAYCNRGGKIVKATAADLQALDRAMQPVYAELDQDASTKAMMDRIRQLKSSVPVPATGVGSPC
ncbi:TRAP-type C4-dicarboxylate transport system substrate-binding protein [Kribbella steppae]|uniref:TRAP-type C4-dicarboxylate transport system substrate-binding protein n=1 Tax=Kribbella steppae TaxID=2512223 RepID=A0A4R2H1S1_9ACTN|nr:TRAP-type C4-dicarboxylate transport system substrate-binding protein [Kribbella steppae]